MSSARDLLQQRERVPQLGPGPGLRRERLLEVLPHAERPAGALEHHDALLRDLAQGRDQVLEQLDVDRVEPVRAFEPDDRHGAAAIDRDGRAHDAEPGHDPRALDAAPGDG